MKFRIQLPLAAAILALGLSACASGPLARDGSSGNSVATSSQRDRNASTGSSRAPATGPGSPGWPVPSLQSGS